ncbi:7225_t:CDS:2, partial [Acaulospora colombiana]
MGKTLGEIAEINLPEEHQNHLFPMSSTSAAIDPLETVPRYEGLDKIYDSTLKCLSILVPWQEA